MAASIGEIGLDLVVNQNQFRSQMSGITGLAKKAGAALAGAFAVSKIVDFGKKCLELGSDLAEVQNVVDVTFPNMTAQVDEFAKSAAQSFGLSETMAKRYTGTFGAMAKAFGFTEKQAYEMGTTLTGLAGDVASFYNLSQDEAYTKIKSVFTGETESLKDLGVVMTQTALDSYAMANGFGKTTSKMTEAEKVALRYAFVQDQLLAAQGDFARTSGSWANQVRILQLQFDSLKASIGQGLINLFTPIIKTVNTLIGKLATLANAFKSFTELITGQKSSGSSTVASPVSDLANTAGDAEDGLENASGAADDLSKSTNNVGSAAKKAAKQLRSLMGFDQMNKLDKKTDTTTTNNKKGTGTGSLGDTVDFGNLAEEAYEKEPDWKRVFRGKYEIATKGEKTWFREYIKDYKFSSEKSVGKKIKVGTNWAGVVFSGILNAIDNYEEFGTTKSKRFWEETLLETAFEVMEDITVRAVVSVALTAICGGATVVAISAVTVGVIWAIDVANGYITEKSGGESKRAAEAVSDFILDIGKTKKGEE